jgi:hypothetical protein
MRRNILIAIGCMISTLAFAQEKGKGNPALEKWRACADAAAARYSKSAESAPVVARYAIMSCHDEKKAASEALIQEQGPRFAEEFIEAAERRYTDLLAIDIIEMRLKH